MQTIHISYVNSAPLLITLCLQVHCSARMHRKQQYTRSGSTSTTARRILIYTSAMARHLMNAVETYYQPTQQPSYTRISARQHTNVKTVCNELAAPTCLPLQTLNLFDTLSGRHRNQCALGSQKSLSGAGTRSV